VCGGIYQGAQPVFLQDLTALYWNGQQVEFDMALKAFNSLVKKRVQEKSSSTLITPELICN